MVIENDNAKESRPPTLEDLLGLCRRLNEKGAKYIVIGGMAMVHHGFVRATEVIDLLVETSLKMKRLSLRRYRTFPIERRAK